MKIRKGFISNSSSTSFIVAWDKPVRKLSDVAKFVSNRTYAKRIFSQLEKQEGTILCSPPQEKCDQCKYRFLCFSYRGKCQVLERLRSWYGEVDGNFDKDYTTMLLNFVERNEGRVAYFLRFMDGDVTESNMRQKSDYILRLIPHEDIT